MSDSKKEEEKGLLGDWGDLNSGDGSEDDNEYGPYRTKEPIACVQVDQKFTEMNKASSTNSDEDEETDEYIVTRKELNEAEITLKKHHETTDDFFDSLKRICTVCRDEGNWDQIELFVCLTCADIVYKSAMIDVPEAVEGKECKETVSDESSEDDEEMPLGMHLHFVWWVSNELINASDRRLYNSAKALIFDELPTDAFSSCLKEIFYNLYICIK